MITSGACALSIKNLTHSGQLQPTLVLALFMAVRWDGCSSFRERTQSLWNTLSHIRHGYCSSQASNSFLQMWQTSFSLKINNKNDATNRQYKRFFLLFDICPLNFFHYMYFRKPIVVHSATGETKSISSQFKSINQFVRLRIIRILWTFYKAFKIMNLNLGIGNTIKRRRTPDLHFLIWKNLLFFLCNVPINNNLYIRYSFYTNS